MQKGDKRKKNEKLNERKEGRKEGREVGRTHVMYPAELVFCECNPNMQGGKGLFFCFSIYCWERDETSLDILKKAITQAVYMTFCFFSITSSEKYRI